eukprot:8451555-Ditylum_brightwellii.AAC.1
MLKRGNPDPYHWCSNLPYVFPLILFTGTKMVPTVTNRDPLKSPYDPTDWDPSEVTADEVPATTC